MTIPQWTFGIYRYNIGAFDRDLARSELYRAGLALFQNKVSVGFYDNPHDASRRSTFYTFGGTFDMTLGIVGLSHGIDWARRYQIGTSETAITATGLGLFDPWEFRFRDRADFNDRTAIAIYDAQGNAVPGGTVFNSQIAAHAHLVTLAPGRYHLSVYSSFLTPRDYTPAVTRNHHNLAIMMAGNRGPDSGLSRIDTVTRSQ